MSLLKSLKISNPDKLKDLDFISKLKTPELLSKLLITVYDLQQEVTTLRGQVEQYENLNSLLEGEDLSKESVQATPPPTESTTPEPPTLVEKITTQEVNETTPTGFTPMFGSPAITASETLGKPQKRTVIKPWPELTLSQLATKFKIPKELLQQSSKQISLQKRKDALKPMSRTSRTDYSPLSKSITPPTTNTTNSIGRQSRNSLKRQYDDTPDELPPKKKPVRTTTTTITVTPSTSNPSTANVLKNSTNSLKYSMTSNGNYKCDSCNDNATYNSYLDVYNHKKANHVDEFGINNKIIGISTNVDVKPMEEGDDDVKLLIETADEVIEEQPVVKVNKTDVAQSQPRSLPSNVTNDSKSTREHINHDGNNSTTQELTTIHGTAIHENKPTMNHAIKASSTNCKLEHPNNQQSSGSSGSSNQLKHDNKSSGGLNSSSSTRAVPAVETNGAEDGLTKDSTPVISIHSQL